jgi:hypothetical protein
VQLQCADGTFEQPCSENVDTPEYSSKKKLAIGLILGLLFAALAMVAAAAGWWRYTRADRKLAQQRTDDDDDDDDIDGIDTLYAFGDAHTPRALRLQGQNRTHHSLAGGLQPAMEYQVGSITFRLSLPAFVVYDCLLYYKVTRICYICIVTRAHHSLAGELQPTLKYQVRSFLALITCICF